MNPTDKDHLLNETKAHISQTTQQLHAAVGRMDQSISEAEAAYLAIDGAESETATEDRLRALASQTNTATLREQTVQLAESPYFSRLDLSFEDEPLRPYYIGKHSASELGIYSWTSAIAALRFESPGDVSYQPPGDAQRTGQLLRRDQYMIARSHLNFMTTETPGRERELIYQEHFSGRKAGFVLPEVVAQMEKAQDQVVRADHRGPFVIAGPAGSGKTTLALHRVAYLRQSPETAELYPPESILVLVQDTGTEDYFSHLLPELGIHDVAITTFAHWALGQLGLRRYVYVPRPGRDELERDRYEYAKLQALRSRTRAVTEKELKLPGRMLAEHYWSFMDKGQQALLAGQLDDYTLDRFDLTLLLLWQRRAENGLMTNIEDVTYLKAGLTRRTLRRAPLRHSLVLVDEFQNYLPEQLRLLRGTTGKMQSMLYIGDLAQQTQLGAVQGWQEAGQEIEPERHIRLQKVYRNTRQILEYIRTKGYEVDIPAGVAEGPEVVEQPARDVVESLQYITGLTRTPGAQMGIIAPSPEAIETYRDYFASDESVRCMTMAEAQGVEFDVVCLVGALETTIALSDDAGLAAEQQRIHRDQLYVALTRAMTELHVIG